MLQTKFPGFTWRRAFSAVVALACAGAAFWVLQRYVASTAWPVVAAGIENVPTVRVAMAILLTGLSFAMLGAYEVLACGVAAPRQVPTAAAVLAGVAGNAVSNTLGFHAVTGAAIRLRIYRNLGLSFADAARVVSLSWFAIALGIVGMFAASALFGAFTAQRFQPGKASLGLGLAMALVLIALGLPRHGRAVTFRKFSIALPSRCVVVSFMGLGAIENGAAIAAMYVLLPAQSAPSFTLFAVSYMSAVTLGIVSQIPGGLGVFEAAMLGVWAPSMGSQLLPALVLYRLIYNILPFVLSTFALMGWELRALRQSRRTASSTADTV